MLSTLIRLDRSTRRLSSLALVGAATLAACDTDKSVAPRTDAVPSDASPLILQLKPSALIITIVDQNGKAPKTVGAQFTITAAGGPSVFLIDNGSGDADPTPNVIKRLNLLGAYNLCQTVAPPDYVLPTTPCQSVSVGGGIMTNVKFIDSTVGLIQFSAVDIFDGGVKGATFSVDLGNGPVSVLDNSALDLDKNPGRFLVKAPNGTFNICPGTPAAGWFFNVAAQGCGNGTAPAGQTTWVAAWRMYAAYSVAVLVGDPITWGAGPSTYTVTNANGFSVTLVDQGPIDRSSKLGYLYMVLPAAGDYMICQTTPPPGTKLANQPCVQFSVQYNNDPIVTVTFTSDWL